MPNANLRSPAALSRFLLTTLIGLGLDLWSKHIAFTVLASGPPFRVVDRFDHARWIVYPRSDLAGTHGRVVIPGWLNLQVTVNEGAVFGIGQGQRWIFLVISVAAIVFLSYLFSTSGRQRFYQVILGMLLAGVLGNMHDRWRFGYVRDMIYGLPGWHWPGSQREVFPWIFNVADVLLCVGVALIFLHTLFHAKPSRKSTPAAAD